MSPDQSGFPIQATKRSRHGRVENADSEHRRRRRFVWRHSGRPIHRQTVNVLCDVEREIPFKDKAFGEVYSKNLLEHLKNPFAALLEMKRVLKRGRHLIITTDNAACRSTFTPDPCIAEWVIRERDKRTGTTPSSHEITC